MRRTEAHARLGGLAAGQFGLVTSAQAAQRGIEGKTLQRLREAGLLEQVGRGVYQVIGAVTPTHLEIRVAWLRLDPERPAWERDGRGMRDGVVSHRSACLLHRVGDIPAPNVELTVPQRLTTRDPWVVLHQHRGPLPEREITVVDGLPVTTVERTVLDLLRDRADAGHVGGVIADAENRGLLDLDTLARKVQVFARHYAMPEATGAELLSALAAAAERSLNRDSAIDALAKTAAAAYMDAVRHTLAQAAPTEDWRGIDVARMLTSTGQGTAFSEVTKSITAALAPALEPLREAVQRIADAQLGPVAAHVNQSVAAQLARSLDSLPRTIAVPVSRWAVAGGADELTPKALVRLSPPVRAALERADTQTTPGSGEPS